MSTDSISDASPPTRSDTQMMSSNQHLEITRSSSQSEPTESSSQNQPFDISSPVQYNHKLLPRFEEASSPHLQTKSQKTQIRPRLLTSPWATAPLGEPTYFTRPNRYFGPESTWRSYTEQDRAVSTSLERIVSEDLSTHLYNAYALRRRGEKVKALRLAALKGKARVKVGGDDTTTEGGYEFIPPRIWTTWPLPPSEVPREELLPSVYTKDTIKGSKDVGSSSSLEECLIACTTRFAKQRWESRDWEDASKLNDLEHKIATTSKRRESITERGRKSTTRKKSQPTQDDPRSKIVTTDRESSSRESDVPSTPNSPSPNPSERPESNEPAIQYFSSQAFAPLSSSASQSSEESAVSDSNREEYTPAFTADDDETRELLLPSTRHVISNVEKLLMAMHRSREAYGYGRAASRSRSGSQSRGRSRTLRPVIADNSAPEDSAVDGAMDVDVDPDIVMEDAYSSDTVSKRRSGSNQSNSRKRTSKSKTPGQYSSSTKSRTSPQSISRSQSPAKSYLKPHDWSSVIGMASILSIFNPETIERASERCARLMDENMMFRIFHERRSSNIEGSGGQAPSEDIASTRPSFDEYFATGEIEAGEDTSELDKDDRQMNDKSPSETAASVESPSKVGSQTRLRTSAACQRCHKRKIRCKAPIQHSSTATNPSTVHGSTTTSDLVPCVTCLQLNIPCSGTTAIPTLKRTASTLSSTLPSTLHCPISHCPRSSTNGAPFSRATRLYTHIRTSHPDLNVKDVKEMVAGSRGAKRGKWTDKRRMRSRSLKGKGREEVEEEDGDDGEVEDGAQNEDREERATQGEGEGYDVHEVDERYEDREWNEDEE